MATPDTKGKTKEPPRRYFNNRLSRKQYLWFVTILSIVAFLGLCLLLLYTVSSKLSPKKDAKND